MESLKNGSLPDAHTQHLTITQADVITDSVRFKGGATRELTLPRPLFPWEEWKTSEEVLAEIDRLLDHHTYGEIATLLNERGLTTGGGKKLDGYRVKRIRREYKLRSRERRLRERGLLSLEEASEMLGFCKAIVRRKRAKGTLPTAEHKLNDMGEYMYEPLLPENTEKSSHCSSSDRRGAI